MRSAVAVVAVVSAVLGGLVALGVGSLAGWVGESATETVVVSSGAPAASSDEDGSAATARSTARPLPGNGFDPARLYAERADGVVTIYALFGDHDDTGGAAQGSGFVVSPEGYVLTNAHVITTAGEENEGGDVEGASRIFVEFRDGDRVPGRIVGWDIFDDVGVVKVDPKLHELSPVPLGDSSRVVVGEAVAAIGSPFGEESSLSVGVVSATQRSIAALTSGYRLVDAIQTDAPINRGNSGGPLFDARGRVIGINAQIRSNSGNAEGVGFAVPINSARRSFEQIVRNGRVAYAYVGVSADDLTPSLARRLGYEVERGAILARVNAGPARRAGLRGGTREISFNGMELCAGGDVVVAIDGTTVRSGDDLVRIVTERLKPGQVATFTVLRNGRRLNVPVRLTERPADPPDRPAVTNGECGA